MTKRKKTAKAQHSVSGAKALKNEVKREAVAAVAGAAVGATAGAVAGPPGAMAGAAIGAVAGALAERAMELDEEERAAENAKLDAEIGVTKGELGAPNLKHPPSRVGAFSPASVGVTEGGVRPPAEGPISEPPDDD